MTIVDVSKDPLDVLSILNAMPGNYLVLLPDAPLFTIVGASDDYLSATYLTRQEAFGRGVFEVLPDNRENTEATGVKNLSASLCAVVDKRREERMADQRYDILNPVTQHWEERVWKPLNRPVFDVGGEVRYIIHWVEDITQKRALENKALQVEAALIEKDESLHNIIDQAPVAMFIFRGPELIIDSINKIALAMIQRTNEVLGKPLLQAIPELKDAPAYQIIQQVYRTGAAQYGWEVLVPLERDGKMEDRYFNFAYTPLKENGQVVGVMDVATEVTEQVVARHILEAVQETTEQQKRLYEAITNNTPDLLYIFDLNYRFRYANEALLRMWGEPEELALGKGLRELGYEEWHAQMHEQEIEEIVATKKSIRGTVSFLHAELGKRIYDYLLVPVLNEEGKVEAVAGTTRDITDIKAGETLLEEKVKERTLELQAINGELGRSNASLEEFAHAASHDLKEPIRKIHFFIHQLKEQLGGRLNESERDSFTRIEKATRRMGDLVDDLLLYSQLSYHPHAKEPVDLNGLVQYVLEVLELDIEQKTAVIQVSSLPVVQGYRRQLQQIFQNLLSNAIKYSRPGNRPQIDVWAEKNIVGNQAYDTICVKDNGIGFEQEYAEKIFQLFTRLHGRSEYNGTGIGLSIVKKAADNHQGFVRAEGVPGEGAFFCVYLPQMV